MKNMIVTDVGESVIKKMKMKILGLAKDKREGHLGSSFSILHLVYQIYLDRIVPTLGYSDNKNIFILSKGHAALALYVVMNEFAILDDKVLRSYCEFDSLLGGHPHLKKIPGAHASTGSLGHGLAIASGIALAKKIKGNSGNIYCLIGDGEANEGSVWEAALLAAHHKLDNLVCIMDMNMSGERAVSINDISLKFRAFNFEVYDIDGHNMEQIRQVLCSHVANDRPKFILANTVKGQGVKRMENNPAWHHAFPTDEEYKEMIAELEVI